MSDKEGFLGRWSRLKQQARTEPEPAAEPPVITEQAEPAIALEDLPCLDSLGPESDYTPFLRPGVPAELRSQALRQAWVSDKAISDFRGLNDYDWDFNAPGYGQLWALDDVQKLAQRIFGESDDDPPPADPAGSEAVAEAAPLPAPEESLQSEATALDQASPEAEPAKEAPAAPRLRRHGGAVPS